MSCLSNLIISYSLQLVKLAARCLWLAACGLAPARSCVSARHQVTCGLALPNWILQGKRQVTCCLVQRPAALFNGACSSLLDPRSLALLNFCPGTSDQGSRARSCIAIKPVPLILDRYPKVRLTSGTRKDYRDPPAEEVTLGGYKFCLLCPCIPNSI